MKNTYASFTFIVILYSLMNLAIPVSAQFYDPFSDGNYTVNPTWTGDTARFKVNVSHRLQTKDTVAGRSYLSTTTPLASLNNIQWSFYIHLGFPPSANNNARVYLTSDSANLNNGLHGYFLQFGEALSLDAVELFRQDDTVLTSLCRGINGQIAAPFYLGVKVARDSTGYWQLFVDTLGGTNYVLEASATDLTYINSSWFGVACKYTTSNAVSFYFDNFNVSSSLCAVGATASQSNVICFGDSTGMATLTGSGGLPPYSYSWSPDGQTTSTITGLPAGVYTGTVIDINLCTAEAKVNIIEPPELIFGASGTEASCSSCCDGVEMLNPSGGTPPYSYLWSTGETTQSVGSLCPDTITVTVTDAMGCAVTDTIIVTFDVAVNEILSENIFQVSPNPIADKLFLHFPASLKQQGLLSILNTLGEVIFRKNIVLEDQTLDLSSFPQGIYLLSLQTETGIFTKKIVRE
ncbi:MAG: T9SS type A sorting domain-containing protein [Bacteroidota bacterium]